MGTVTAGEQTRSGDAVAVGIVDCDVHPQLPAGMNSLKPYLSDSWKRRMFGPISEHAWAQNLNAAQFQLPANRTFINSTGGTRRDAAPAGGGMPGCDPGTVVKDLFEGYGITRAILIGGDVFGLSALPDPDAAAAAGSAYNDWLAGEWLAFDNRFRAGIVIAAQDPALAAQEINRMASNRGFAAVYMPLTNRLMGDRFYYPIYEAAATHGLPIILHPNAVDAMYTTAPSLAGGVPTYYIEWHAALSQIFQANVISLVCHGVFERFKDLKVVVAEGGIAWLMDVMWRLDKDWKGLRDEVPWVKRPPSEYIIDHVRLTTQPFIEPETREQLLMTLSAVHADRTLLFSSDYPHWDFDSPTRALELLPAELRTRIQWHNAVETFGSRL